MQKHMHTTVCGIVTKSQEVRPWTQVHRLVCVCGQSCEGVKKTLHWIQRKSSSTKQTTLFIQYSVEGVTLRPSGMDQVVCITFEWLSPVASAKSDIVDGLFQTATRFKRDFKRTSESWLFFFVPTWQSYFVFDSFSHHLICNFQTLLKWF